MATAAERMRAYRQRHLEEVRERERQRRRMRAREYDPVQRRAWNSVAAAIRHGKMKREPCVVCGDLETQAHHTDYTKPRQVTWLCRTHHERAHGRMGTAP